MQCRVRVTGIEETLYKRTPKSEREKDQREKVMEKRPEWLVLYIIILII